MANVLAGDVGGTTTRLGVFDTAGTRPRLVALRTYATLEFNTLERMAAAFLNEVAVDPRSIRAACVGAAGPVTGDVVVLTNTPVRVDATAIAAAIGVARVSLLNDLEALAYALPVLADDELHVLQAGVAARSGAMAVIAAGTGLGEAALYTVDGRPVAVASEGGHADFAARTERDVLVLRDLVRRRGRAEVEQVVSGIGLVNIHRAIQDGCDAAIDFADLDAPSAISTSAAARRCAGCVDALEMFVAAYGAEAGNLALRTVATGGVFVGGGIAPKLLPTLTDGAFLRAFRDKAPFAAMLEAMPVKIILNDTAGLLGAANFCSILREP